MSSLRRVLAIVLALVAGVTAGPLMAAEVIESFHSNIIVRVDGVLDVTETIRVRAEGRQIKRGIFRDFPTIYTNDFGTRVRTSFEVIDVRMDGREVPWTLQSIQNGKRVRIGDKDRFLETGSYTYTIRYLSARQLVFGEAQDELYWNVTGTDWAFPILQASARVVLPEGARVLDTTAFTGAQGAKEKNYADVLGEDGSVRFSTIGQLGRNQGLTIAVTWPAGLISRPDEVDKLRYFLSDNGAMATGIGGIFLLLFYFYVFWSNLGKDPEGGPIIARYEPPKGFSPAACRYILKMGYDQVAFTAAILSMAVKGYYEIEEEGDGFRIRRTKGWHDKLFPGEQAIANNLISGSRESVGIGAKHSERVEKTVKKFKSALKAEYERDYFVHNRGPLIGGIALAVAIVVAMAFSSPDPIGGLFMLVWNGIVLGVAASIIIKKGASFGNMAGAVSAIGAAVSIIPLGFMLTVGGSMLVELMAPISLFFIVVIGVICIIFARLLKAPTEIGRRVLDEIEGFKLYLGVAEKDRLNFHNPPDMSPDHFEELLPYAIALDVEHEWGEMFDSVLAKAAEKPGEPYHPRWYRGSRYGGRNFNSSSFSSAIGSSLSSAVASASTPPSSSGSSGFSGGSSGGGGGGGGGGGW